jgi:DNA-binding response OmpR family regulator
VINDPILAVSNYKSGEYDLIILDVRIPKIDGSELFRFSES